MKGKTIFFFKKLWGQPGFTDKSFFLGGKKQGVGGGGDGGGRHDGKEFIIIICRLYAGCLQFFLWLCGPTRAMTSSLLRFLDHTQRRITVGRTLLDEWSARRRDLYLTTHNAHNRQTSMPPVRFEPTISAGERPQTYVLAREATGTGVFTITYLKQTMLPGSVVLHLFCGYNLCYV